MTHPLKSKNPDTACRWLAINAGLMSAGDCEVMREVLEDMPYRGQPLPPQVMPPFPDLEDLE